MGVIRRLRSFSKTWNNSSTKTALPLAILRPNGRRRRRWATEEGRGEQQTVATWTQCPHWSDKWAFQRPGDTRSKTWHNCSKRRSGVKLGGINWPLSARVGNLDAKRTIDRFLFQCIRRWTPPETLTAPRDTKWSKPKKKKQKRDQKYC